MDESVLVRGDQQRELAAHVVDRHGDVGLANLLKCLTAGRPGPELDFCVPATRYDDRGIVLRVDEADHIFDWHSVLSNVCRYLCVQVEFLDAIVRASK